MSLESHLQQLKRKHEALDAKITTEQRRPGRDESEVKALKKKKLKLKDEMYRARSRAS